MAIRIIFENNNKYNEALPPIKNPLNDERASKHIYIYINKILIILIILNKID